MVRKDLSAMRKLWKVINKNINNQASSRKVVIKENDVYLDPKLVPYRFIIYFANIPLELIKKFKSVKINSNKAINSVDCTAAFSASFSITLLWLNGLARTVRRPN